MRQSLVLGCFLAAGCGQPEPEATEVAAVFTAGAPHGPTLEEMDFSVKPSATPPGTETVAVSNAEAVADDHGEMDHGCELVAIEVRHGETLIQLAEWTGVPAEEIASNSGLQVQGTIYAGQELWLPISEEKAQELERTRNLYEDGHLDRWLARHGGLLAVSPVALGTRDTVWALARDSGGLPLWVVQAFNRGRDLDRLRIGDEIYMPVVGNMVTVTDAEAAPETELAIATVEGSGNGQP